MNKVRTNESFREKEAENASQRDAGTT